VLALFSRSTLSEQLDFHFLEKLIEQLGHMSRNHVMSHGSVVLWCSIDFFSDLSSLKVCARSSTSARSLAAQPACGNGCGLCCRLVHVCWGQLGWHAAVVEAKDVVAAGSQGAVAEAITAARPLCTMAKASAATIPAACQLVHEDTHEREERRQKRNSFIALTQ
jgi:hypothetical protein